jgi:hypothetical protein
MALNLRQIQLAQRKVPLEQIVAAKGQSPVGAGIEQAGALVGKALERKAELQRRGQQVDAIQKAFPGQALPNGIDDPQLALNILGKQAELEKAGKLNETWIDQGIDPKTNKIVQREGRTGAIRLVDNPVGGQLLPMTQGNSSDGIDERRQDKLEKIHADRMAKILSNRSGGLGLQDAKTNQAIDLRTLINQNYDPATKTYKIPPSMHSELVLGLARLVSPTGTIGIELENELKQKTAHEGLANMYTYLTGQPVTGPSQDVAKLFINSIDRQGQTAEKLRNKYLSDLKHLRPSGLDPKIADSIESNNMGSSFSELLNQSPDIMSQQPGKLPPLPAPGGTVTIRASDGSMHKLPAVNLEKAKQRDPGLQVIQ